MRKDAPGRLSGFSLVESAITLALLAIVLGLALPGFGETLQKQRAASATHLLVTQMAQARNTAVTRGVPVTVCPSRGDGLCSGTADWSEGWLLYRDPQRSPQPRMPADVLRQVHRPVRAPVRISSSQARIRVRYQPDGRSGGSNLTLRVCRNSTLQNEIILNNSGRTRVRPAPPGKACPG